MTTAKYVRTIALAKVTSTGSGGRATIIHSIRPVTDLGHLTNKAFCSMNVGQIVEVAVLVKPGRRTVASVRKVDMPISISTWIAEHRESLNTQETLYNERFSKIVVTGTDGSSTDIPFGATSAPTQTLPRFEVPSGAVLLSDAFYLPEEINSAFFAAQAISGKVPAKILFTGPSGYGKTSSAEAWASHNGYGFVRVNTALINDREEAFFYRTVDEGSVNYIPTALTRGLTTQKTVVVLDELNRTSPEMLNALFPILDDSAETEIFGRKIAVAQDVIIVATINEGYAFSGTFSIDGALRNRFDITIIVSTLPNAVEEEILMRRTGIDSGNAKKIVDLVTMIRSANTQEKIAVDASTRTTLRMAKILASTNLDLRNVFQMTILNGANAEDRKELLDIFSLSTRR